MKKTLLLFLLISLLVFPIVGYFTYGNSSIAFFEIEKQADDCSRGKVQYEAKTLLTLRGNLPKKVIFVTDEFSSSCPPLPVPSPRITIGRPCPLYFSRFGPIFTEGILFNDSDLAIKAGDTYILRVSPARFSENFQIGTDSCNGSGYVGKAVSSIFGWVFYLIIFCFDLFLKGYWTVVSFSTSLASVSVGKIFAGTIFIFLLLLWPLVIIFFISLILSKLLDKPSKRANKK